MQETEGLKRTRLCLSAFRSIFFSGISHTQFFENFLALLDSSATNSSVVSQNQNKKGLLPKNKRTAVNSTSLMGTTRTQERRVPRKRCSREALLSSRIA